MDFDEWVAIHFAGDIVYADSWVYNKKHLHEAFEAGRESVIANRETFQKVKAEGVREGMERTSKIIASTGVTTSANTIQVIEITEEYLKAIRKEIDNDYPN